MDRRRLLQSGAALLVVPKIVRAAAPAVMPSLFFSHGAPFLANDRVRGKQLSDLVQDLPRTPRGIVAVTPHVRSEYVSVASHGTARRSFPRRFIKRIGDVAYQPPLADELAEQVRSLLNSSHIPLAATPHKAFNHTVWMGLLHMFPQANIPVVEMSMPFLGPRRLFALGQALAPLRQADVLVISSGSLTHNLDAVLDWREKAPAADIAHPDDGGHFNVVLYALGAAVGSSANFDSAHAANLDFEFGSFSTRDYLFR